MVRGARQVGKTWLIRELARKRGKELIEINFERDPLARGWFASNDPRVILGEISLAFNRSITPENTLLFLDEIQAASDILAKLRWFYEEQPQCAVAAAGSLLEFSLSDHTFSMPVGRIHYLHVEPMSFQEFLEAHGQTILLERLRCWHHGMDFSPLFHTQATSWFNRYMMVGGMPAIVKSDVEGASARRCREQQMDLVTTYRDDFAKYRKRLDSAILDTTLLAVSRSLGDKFVYSHVGEGVKAFQAKNALELLAKAKVCHIVHYSAANGLPLGGEAKESFRKIIFNDVGILHALFRTPAADSFPEWEHIAPQIRAQIAEQITGQQLRLYGPLSGDGPQLFYWQREGGRPGEIDYLVQLNSTIVPIELKSGAAGSMKSLHQFMFDKKLDLALRFDRNPPSQCDLQLTTTQGDAVSFRLCSLPLYYAGFSEKMLIDLCNNDRQV
ncbi:MAG: ATP-binding protein [Chitinivibrionales bacterium]|nr:ATP-binding protein [Chitinivibrionales bacterium]